MFGFNISIKYVSIYLILAIIGSLSFIIADFYQLEDLILILKFLIFPGILFIFISILFIDWFDRKFYARMQNRMGPRYCQPFYDVIKLLLKEDITPNGVDKLEFNILPAIQFILTILIAFMVPIYIVEGLISFEGDLFFVLFLFALIGSIIFLIGWASNNSYSSIGGNRAAIAELGFEIPLALSFICPAIITGSLKISEITGGGYSFIDIIVNYILEYPEGSMKELLFLIPLFICFIISIGAFPSNS